MPLEIRYTIAMPQPESHRFHITLEVTGWEARQTTLLLPAWTPGSYLIREFSRHVESFRAESAAGAPLPWQRVAKNRWHVATEGVSAFRVRYEVYANELTVRTSHLDSTHGYFNGANVFMYPEGQLRHPVTLRVEAPAGWHCSIALPQNERGEYEASSYDLLVDSPGEVGTHRVLRFQAMGKPHEIALWGRGNEREGQLVQDLKQIVENVAQMFGGTVPYDRYLFIVHLGDRLGGGLEHLNSTSLAVDRWTFEPRSEYEKFLRLAAHEYFHVWNVKRIRPHNLGPFDYTQEVYTPLLWVMEGFTTYYDILLLRRAGLVGPHRCLLAYGERIATYRQQPGRLVQSLEESSLTAWVKFYRQDENYVNSGISYYLKGSLVAWVLDFHIRHNSHNRRSLDDVMRHLWQRYGQRDVGFTEAEFCAAVNEAGGIEVEPFLQRFVRGTEELPLEEFLTLAGLELVTERKPSTPAVWTGVIVKQEPEGLVVKNVLRDSPAEAAGLVAKDRLLALDNYEILDEIFWCARLSERMPGDRIRLHLFRAGELLHKEIVLAPTPPDTVTLYLREAALPLQREILSSWFATPWSTLARG